MTPIASLQRALDTIEAHLTEPLAVESLARKAGMSRWHFQRSFAAVVGEAVGGYIRRRRLTEAARRLRSGPQTILDVALTFQFESHEAFTRAFRSQFYFTPSAWRRGRGALSRALGPVNLDQARSRLSRMKPNPEIVTVPAATYVGLQAPFIMVISPDANNMEVIPQLWRDFLARRHEIPVGPGEPAALFGLCQSPEAAGAKRGHADEAMYLAAVELPVGAKAPKGMVTWKVPANTYAQFVHRGPVETCGETYMMIYGKWLGTEGHPRGRGPDIERYGPAFCLGKAESEFDILVPIAGTQASS